MHPLILVSMLVVAGVALLAGVALWRGWLRLASVPADSRVHFILIGKKVKPPGGEEPGDHPPAAETPERQQAGPK